AKTSTSRRPGTEWWELPWRRMVLRRREAPIRFSWAASPEKEALRGHHQIRGREVDSAIPARTSRLHHPRVLLPKRHQSRPTYHRIRAEGRGPVEMRLGLHAMPHEADAAGDWHRLMQEPRPDLEVRTAERAVKAGDAAVKSSRHISKRWRARNSAPKRVTRAIEKRPSE